ncbi:GntR family transcriptional regulator [Nonomuraea gerenzanensis]|uniref:Transcriptional regulator KorSA, GntR family n=1 Tax=Nonomuraea gerenzanensis TaxID=93944 RepID=A0A1M4DYM1_9ACTN|nr:GntR family transcriptional regulator [Nonomuraea gerenzanensis]UBU13992.1 GntR family transcriptional regulator [Nonomuraea gerenzanensis]SBO91678.1 Transcriptional regulator KorSA, GntR family [Nonomuraea gerenzanensis]
MDLILPGLDPESDRPVFKQMADHLREAIEHGRLAPGAKVPSEATLMAHYGVARMTVRSALQLLQSEGLTVAEHGRGVFVRSRPPVRRLASDRFARRHRQRGKAAFIVETEESGGKPSVDSIRITEVDASADVAKRLGLTVQDKILVRSRRYLINGHPVETAVSYLPAAIASGTRIAEPDTGPGGIYARLEEMGYRLDHFDEEIKARMPLREEAKALKLAPGTPVFHLIRTAFTEDGRAVEVCDTVMSSDAYVLAYQLPAR